MKHPEYIEGQQALDSFKQGMIALFKAEETKRKTAGQTYRFSRARAEIRQRLKGNLLRFPRPCRLVARRLAVLAPLTLLLLFLSITYTRPMGSCAVKPRFLALR